MRIEKTSALMVTLVTLIWTASASVDPTEEAGSIRGPHLLVSDTEGKTQDEETMILDLGLTGLSMSEFATLYRQQTGHHVIYDSRIFQARQIECQSGPIAYRKADAAEVLGSLLMAHDIAVVKQKTAKINLVKFVDVKTSQGLKQAAPCLAPEKILSGAVAPMEVVSCVVPLERVQASEVQSILLAFVQEHRVSSVSAHVESNSVVLCNFAGALRTQIEIARHLDARGAWAPGRRADEDGAK